MTHFIHLKSFAVDTPTRTPPEREIVCVTLKKDQKLGFGELHEPQISMAEMCKPKCETLLQAPLKNLQLAKQIALWRPTTRKTKLR